MRLCTRGAGVRNLARSDNWRDDAPRLHAARFSCSSLNRSRGLRSVYRLCWRPFFGLMSVRFWGRGCRRARCARVRAGSDRAGSVLLVIARGSRQVRTGTARRQAVRGRDFALGGPRLVSATWGVNSRWHRARRDRCRWLHECRTGVPSAGCCWQARAVFRSARFRRCGIGP